MFSILTFRFMTVCALFIHFIKKIEKIFRVKKDKFYKKDLNILQHDWIKKGGGGIWAAKGERGGKGHEWREHQEFPALSSEKEIKKAWVLPFNQTCVDYSRPMIVPTSKISQHMLKWQPTTYSKALSALISGNIVLDQIRELPLQNITLMHA